MQVGNEIQYQDEGQILRGYVAEQNKDKTFLIRFYNSEKTLDLPSDNTDLKILAEETLKGFCAITLTDEDGKNLFASIRLEEHKFELLEKAAREKKVSTEEFMLEALQDYLDKELAKFEKTDKDGFIIDI